MRDACRVDTFITRTPLAKLTQIMAWANRANGVLLLLAGLFGFFGAFSRVATNMFASALLSIYVAGSGALLLRCEFGASDELRRDCGFMFTFLGRAAFLLLVGVAGRGEDGAVPQRLAALMPDSL